MHRATIIQVAVIPASLAMPRRRPTGILCKALHNWQATYSDRYVDLPLRIYALDFSHGGFCAASEAFSDVPGADA